MRSANDADVMLRLGVLSRERGFLKYDDCRIDLPGKDFPEGLEDEGVERRLGLFLDDGSADEFNGQFAEPVVIRDGETRDAVTDRWHFEQCGHARKLCSGSREASRRVAVPSRQSAFTGKQK